jgi:hypothetical protein
LIGLHLFLSSFHFFLTSGNISSHILVADLYRGLHPLSDGVRDGGHLGLHLLLGLPRLSKIVTRRSKSFVLCCRPLSWLPSILDRSSSFFSCPTLPFDWLPSFPEWRLSWLPAFL